MRFPFVAAALLAAACTLPALTHSQEKTRPTLGTTQMAGDNGKIDVAYTIGKTDPINITLHSAQFTVNRWNVNSNSFAPNDKQKLLMLTFTVHNPNPKDTQFHGGTLKFTVVDQEDVNHEYVGEVTRINGTERLVVDLKPAQKIQCQTAILVPAKGTVPKLIVEHRTGGPVLRYDLRPVLKNLPAPFAGESPADAKAEIEGEVGTYYPAMYYDLKFLSHELIEKKFGPATIPDNRIFFMPKFQFKKMAPTGHILRFRGEAISEDGDRYEDQGLKKGSIEEHAGSAFELGQEVTARMMFVLPKGVKITKIRIWEDQSQKSRAYAFPLDLVASLTPATTAQAQTGNRTQPAQPKTADAPVSGPMAYDYTTVLKKDDGSTALEFKHSERQVGQEKTTVLTFGDKKAYLVENQEKGDVTFVVPATGEFYQSKKGGDKDPVTSLDYFSLAYANAAAPKPKSKNPLGGIAGNILGGAVKDLGTQMISGAVLAGFGKASAPKLMDSAVQNVSGYAVHNFAWQLGRAVMTSAQPTEAGGPDRVNAQVTVDKKVYVDTTFNGKHAPQGGEFDFEVGPMKLLSAKDMFQKFSAFFGQGIK